VTDNARANLNLDNDIQKSENFRVSLVTTFGSYPTDFPSSAGAKLEKSFLCCFCCESQMSSEHL